MDINLLLLHQHPKKIEFYNNYKKQIFWSQEFNQWICCDPEKIKQILTHPCFISPSLEVESFEKAFSVNFEHTKKILSYMPINKEGESHIKLKKEFASQISKNMNPCLLTFSSNLDEIITLKFKFFESIDFIQEVIFPALKNAMLTLFDISSDNTGIRNMDFSQILDRFIPLKKRIEIEKNIQIFIEDIQDETPTEEKYFKLAQYTLGFDSIFSTLSASIYFTLRKNQKKQLQDIVWNDRISNTGVPWIARVAKEDVIFNGKKIFKGQAIRLYLESSAFASNDPNQSNYADLFFGHGIHKCVGQYLSDQIWEVLIKKIKKIDKKFIIESASLRDNDYLFLQYKNLIINLYE